MGTNTRPFPPGARDLEVTHPEGERYLVQKGSADSDRMGRLKRLPLLRSFLKSKPTRYTLCALEPASTGGVPVPTQGERKLWVQFTTDLTDLGELLLGRVGRITDLLKEQGSDTAHPVQTLDVDF